jgi:hypothetical protein
LVGHPRQRAPQDTTNATPRTRCSRCPSARAQTCEQCSDSGCILKLGQVPDVGVVHGPLRNWRKEYDGKHSQLCEHGSIVAVRNSSAQIWQVSSPSSCLSPCIRSGRVHQRVIHQRISRPSVPQPHADKLSAKTVWARDFSMQKPFATHLQPAITRVVVKAEPKI